jgi:hypothetical protein
LIRRHELYAKRSKCQFFRTQIEYLGHVFPDEGVSVDPKKIETVVKWPVPKDKTEVRRFLGLATYMRKYVRDFAKIATPMTIATPMKKALKKALTVLSPSLEDHGSLERWASLMHR